MDTDTVTGGVPATHRRGRDVPAGTAGRGAQPPPLRRAGARRPVRRCDQRGTAPVQLALLAPVLILLLMLTVQFGVWYHASHVARAAAQEGARAARLADGTAGAGRDEANRFLDALGPRIVLGRSVEATRSAGTARVEVRGHVPALVPGMTLTVRGSSAGPVERFYGDTEGSAR